MRPGLRLDDRRQERGEKKTPVHTRLDGSTARPDLTSRRRSSGPLSREHLLGHLLPEQHAQRRPARLARRPRGRPDRHGACEPPELVAPVGRAHDEEEEQEVHPRGVDFDEGRRRGGRVWGGAQRRRVEELRVRVALRGVVVGVVVRLRGDNGAERRRARRSRRLCRRRLCRGGARVALDPVHAPVVRVLPRRRVPPETREPPRPPRAPPREAREAQQEREEDVEAVVDRAVEREEPQRGEVRQRADEVALAPAEVPRARDPGWVEAAAGRRDVGWVAKVRVGRIVG